MKEIETGLVLEGSAKFGKALLEEAAKANQEKIQKRVVSTIGELLEQVAVQRQALKMWERMIEALQTGAFSLSKDGKITYTDAELNRDARWISRCSQCGYDKLVIAAHRGA
jgi:hypothetical protein